VLVGQEVGVRVDTFREKALRCQGTTISPVAAVQRGDTIYTLMIDLEPSALKRHPGMTTQGEISVDWFSGLASNLARAVNRPVRSVD
jgi:hypothetical protein